MSTPNRDDVWITGLNWNTFHSVFSRPYLTKFQNTSKSVKKNRLHVLDTEGSQCETTDS